VALLDGVAKQPTEVAKQRALVFDTACVHSEHVVGLIPAALIVRAPKHNPQVCILVTRPKSVSVRVFYNTQPLLISYSTFVTQGCYRAYL
jgi:hypothetical protein